MYGTKEFVSRYTYAGDDLGVRITQTGVSFRVWAPTAVEGKLFLYAGGTDGVDDRLAQIRMQKDSNGTWVASAALTFVGCYYTYCLLIDGAWREACDPYARSCGVNGKRGMVLDLATTDPEGWSTDKSPHQGICATDAVIYELHIRDLTVDPASGVSHKGKYLGLAEKNTHTPGGKPTAISHVRSLGATHVHILPFYDFGSVDETRQDAQYNWGYDPVNYNVPEGSYATDPYDGAVRVREVKEMIKALHEQGLGVIMDVVYNHVFDADAFCFNQIVPGYFSRKNPDGSASNGSGCGNDTASERPMVRKFIVDSVKYWAEEYHIDGFRFDLVGLLDVDTVNAVVSAVHGKHPHVLFYGEGWDLPTWAPDCKLATQKNSPLTPNFAYFSDTLRDMLRGNVFEDTDPGYITGAKVPKTLLQQCFMGLPQWCDAPAQSVNYASCHDNMTLFDRLHTTAPDVNQTLRIRMNRLAAAFYITAQGIPFIHAGEELLRTKRDARGNIVENSYNAPDLVNQIRWSCLEDPEVEQVFAYYKGLIAFRKAHSLLRLSDRQEVLACVHPVCWKEPNGAAFLLEDPRERIFAVFHPDHHPAWIDLPAGIWQRCIDDVCAGIESQMCCQGRIQIPGVSAAVFVQEKRAV